MDENQLPERESIGDAIGKFKQGTNNSIDTPAPTAVASGVPKMQQTAMPRTNFNPQDFENTMSKETDPDLMTSYEVVKLPSDGKFYSHGIGQVDVEYMTSKDEDLLTTPSLIENGTVLNVLLKRKIKTKGIAVEELLEGDRNAILLFLRTSSYGSDYTVTVSDPRSGVPFDTVVDLLQLQYKEVSELPDERGYFSVFIPMRKKTVIFRLLNAGEDNMLSKKAAHMMEAYNEEVSPYNTLRLKASIVAINERSDRSYIDRFVDAMPARDSYTIRRKIIEVSPDVNMAYTFMAKDGYQFVANLTVGVDFFFPST